MNLKYFPLFLLSFSLLAEHPQKSPSKNPFTALINEIGMLPTLTINEDTPGEVSCSITSPLLKEPHALAVPPILVWKDEDNKHEFETKTTEQDPHQHTLVKLQGRSLKNFIQIAAVLTWGKQTHNVQGGRLLAGKKMLFPQQMTSILDPKNGILTLTIPAQDRNKELEPVTTIITTLQKGDDSAQTETPKDATQVTPENE